jgi:hypothetical protein
MTDKIKPEVYEKLEALMKRNSFCLEQETGYSAKPGHLKLSYGAPKTNLKNLEFLKGSAIYRSSDDHYKTFTQELEKEISTWPDDLFLNLYEHSRNSDVNSVLSGVEYALKYTTHPTILDRTTEKNLKKMSKYVQNEERFHVYFEKVMTHPYWENKQEYLKQFLIDNKYTITLNELFPSAAKSDIVKVSTHATATFEVDFSLMPTSNFYADRNEKPHTFSSQSAFLWKMIRDFHTFNIEDSPIKGIYADHTTPKNGIKSVTIFAKTEALANAFADEFFDMFKKELKESFHVGEKNSTGFGSKMMEPFMERLKILSINKDLSENLKDKEIKTKSKKL